MPREQISLATFDEMNGKTCVNSPRSLRACKSEGVMPEELLHRPIDMFQERALSPRLVKLRYDFFEAKRRDLLAASRRAREQLVAEEKREKDVTSRELEVIAKDSGISKGAILALSGDTLKLERQKLMKAQEIERNWLRNALHNELANLKTLEGNNTKLLQEAADDSQANEDAARRVKEVNDKRSAEEEKKTMEMEARQKLERQIAKEEFHKQQEELKLKGQQEALRQQEAYERQLRDMERKKEAEVEKQRKREAAYKEQLAKKNEMLAQDLRRQDIMQNQKSMFQEAMKDKKEGRDLRIYQSIEANHEIEQKRRMEFEEKERQTEIREQRLMENRAMEQEESAKKSFQLMMRRKVIQKDAARKMEDRRMAILESQEDKEQRLLEHEQKKERYLDFKKELDTLRAHNKEINVERQRRKEEFKREETADQVKRKDEKVECMVSERKRLHMIRRAGQSEAYRAREQVKQEIMRQRVSSKFDSKILAKKLSTLMQHELFTPGIIQSSASAPVLRAAQAATRQAQAVPAQ